MGLGEKREIDREEKLMKKETKRQDRWEKRGYFTNGPVTIDNIRKEVINREKKTQEDWMQKYNYLTGEYFKQVLAEECKKAELPLHTFEGKKLSNSMMKKIPFSLKASSAIPKTSSALIGWRSSIVENNLEYVGPFYVSPLTTLEPPLESDGFQIKKQRFIILG